MLIFSKKLLHSGVRKSKGGILQGVVKKLEKFMEVVHFLLLSCSFEKWLLLQWFFTYSTRSPCIALLSSFAVLVRGYFLGRGQLFSGAIFMWCNFSWGKVAGGQLCWGPIVREPIILGGNFPRRQLSLGAIILGAIIRGAIIQGAISQGAIFLGDNGPRTHINIDYANADCIEFEQNKQKIQKRQKVKKLDFQKNR